MAGRSMKIQEASASNNTRPKAIAILPVPQEIKDPRATRASFPANQHSARPPANAPIMVGRHRRRRFAASL